MNPFQSDNIWKKKARQGKAQQHPLTPRQEHLQMGEEAASVQEAKTLHLFYENGN